MVVVIVNAVPVLDHVVVHVFYVVVVIIAVLSTRDIPLKFCQNQVRNS